MYTCIPSVHETLLFQTYHYPDGVYHDSLWELSRVPELTPLMELYLTTVDKRTGTEIVAAFTDTVIPLLKTLQKGWFFFTK